MQTQTTQTLSADQAIAMARQNFQAGELEACAYLCDRILASLPEHVEALHLIGLARFRQGQMEQSLSHLRRALDLAPKNAALLANAVEIMRSAGHRQEAVELGKRAVAAAPKSAPALANLALAYYDCGEFDLSKDLHERALQLAPGHISSLNNLGSMARDEKNRPLAITYYRRVLELAPDNAETHNNLVTVLIEDEQLDLAQTELSRLLSRAPGNAEAHRNQGRIHLMYAQLDAAETSFRRSIEINPALAQSHVGLSQVMLEKNHPDLALAAARKAVEIEPDSALCLHQMGLCHSNLSDEKLAVDAYDKALGIDPAFSASIMGRGHLFMEMGDMASARDAFEQARDLDPDDLYPTMALCRLDKVKTPDDPLLAALEANMPRSGNMAPQKRASFHFALGECYDALGRYDDAFGQYAMGARVKRSLLSYDADLYDRHVDQIIQTFTPEFIDHLRSAALPSATPIFVLGMPRSGTTLTESILASHPQVHGAGELNDLQRIFGFDAQGKSRQFPETLKALPNEALSALAQDYVDRLTAHAPDAAMITDKMPANFHMVGLIHALLPNARIVHIQRHPMDTCLSCFTRLFERSQHHSYDLEELGRAYDAYRRLMQHWRHVLPATAFHELHYEALVADTEQEARSLLQYCGLDWDERCLDFHKSRRRVRTASLSQVRQPVYRGSIEKWRRYQDHLQPLHDILEKWCGQTA
ncbi:MAG: sulfotransferase [Ruegeria sp.]|uniref:sulfotransferase n=1 Tax=Ruegeria sp. TaxID=1879320 RepID=UPI00349E623C